MKHMSATQGRGRTAIAVASIFATALLVTACSGSAQPGGPAPASAPAGSDAPAGGAMSQEDWDALVDAATAEGEVVVYSSLSDVETTFASFEDAYPGITVRVERAPTAELITRLDQEIAVGATGADVTMHSLPGWFASYDEQGTFAPLQVSPDNEASGWSERIDGHTYSASLATPLLLGYNTDTGEALSTADEIFDAPEDARIAIIDPHITSAQAFQYQLWLDEYGDDFLERLSQRDVTVYTSNVPTAQDLAAGARDYGMAVTPSTVLALKNEGAPVDANIPDEAVASVLYNTAVLATAAHPNAAQLFANWLASEDGQAVIVENHTPVAVPNDVGDAVAWDSLTFPDVEEWTNEYWAKWITDNWTPYFE
jgi:iron(III) transport system substrate-binding protein